MEVKVVVIIIIIIVITTNKPAVITATILIIVAIIMLMLCKSIDFILVLCVNLIVFEVLPFLSLRLLTNQHFVLMMISLYLHH